MKTQGQQIRENLEDAQHPDEIEGDEFHSGDYIAYIARLLIEAGDEYESVANALKYLQDNPRDQIAASGKVSDAMENDAPEREAKISALGPSGAMYIRSCRYAAAAIHGAVEHDSS